MTYGLTNAGGGGSDPVLEDRTIVANGTYTASSDYDGFGTVNVEVSATGNSDTGTNRTGSAIASGDKIWVNQYYYAAGSLIKNTRPVAPQTGSGSPATICGLFDSSLTYGFNNSSRQVYNLTTNTVIGTYFANNVTSAQSNSGMYCYNKDGTVFALASGSSFIDAWYLFYGAGNVLEIACTKASSTSASCHYTPVVNKPNWFLDLSTNTMYEVDLTDGSTVTSFAAPNVTHINTGAYHMTSSPIYVDDANIFFPRYNSSTTYYDKYAFDSSNNTFTLVTSNVFSTNAVYPYPLGVTPDSKNILFVTKPVTGSNARTAYLVSLADYSSKQIASYTGTYSADSYFAYYPETGVFYHLLKQSTYNTTGNFYCYRYAQSLESMEVVNLDTISYPCIWAVNKDLTRILWSNAYAAYPNANVNLSTSAEELGNNIIPYSQSNVNTMTATANANIAVNASGSIVLGATGNILESLISDSVKASQIAIGNNIIIATGNSENYAISRNLGAFRLATLPLATDWSGGLAFGNSKFIAVARSGGDFATTADGINWILGTLPVSATWYGMTKSNGIITLHGSMGDYSTIDDGDTWVAV